MLFAEGRSWQDPAAESNRLPTNVTDRELNPIAKAVVIPRILRTAISPTVSSRSNGTSLRGALWTSHSPDGGA